MGRRRCDKNQDQQPMYPHIGIRHLGSEANTENGTNRLKYRHSNAVPDMNLVIDEENDQGRDGVSQDHE